MADALMPLLSSTPYRPRVMSSGRWNVPPPRVQPAIVPAGLPRYVSRSYIADLPNAAVVVTNSRRGSIVLPAITVFLPPYRSAYSALTSLQTSDRAAILPPISMLYGGRAPTLCALIDMFACSSAPSAPIPACMSRAAILSSGLCRTTRPNGAS